MSSEKVNIKDLISEAGKHLRQEFEHIRKSNPHYAESGAEVEIILRDFLNNHLPKRFYSDSGFVIDKENHISSQIDVIIYDALNSPVYRKGERISILPSDNVAVAIEVKSKLNKEELEDCATKISSVKKLKRMPLTNVDEPVTFSPIIMTNTLGVVFAYDSETTLETLAENLVEINSKYPSNEWIDLVVVLDKGVIGYTVQMPFESTFPGWFGGACTDEFPIPPFYIHLVKSDLGELTLNRFFLNLIGHLTFYRRRTAMDFESVLGKQHFDCMTLKGYQYNLKKELVEAEESHIQGKFQNPKVRFNLYRKKDKQFTGQICFWPWQDGAVIIYSGYLPPPPILKPYYDAVGEKKGLIIPAKKDANLWVSSVIPLKESQFISISQNISGDIFSERDSDDENDLPWEKYKK